MLDALSWVFANIFASFGHFFTAITNPGMWLNWSDKEALMRFIYYGGSKEFFFVILTAFLLVTIAGLIWNQVLWSVVRAFEWVANTVGRFFAWAGLLMVLQQIVIVFMQRIFTSADISLAFGTALTFDVSWWAEMLKLHNAMIVCLCATYTFVQGGHVRVDLVYSVVSFRTKRMIDMFGAVFFMMPAALLTWLYAWYFLWRHLITPKVSASDKLELMLRKASIVKWRPETIGFSPNGFNAYFLFKILLLLFTLLVLMQAVAFFYRSYLEWKEGEASEGKYLDRDTLGEGEEAFEGTH